MIGRLIKIEKHHLFFVLLFCSLTLGNCINLRKSFWYFCNLWYIINHLYLPLFQNPKAYTLKFWGGNFCNNIFFFWTSYTESWLFFVLRSIATKLYALNLILQDKISVFFLFSATMRILLVELLCESSLRLWMSLCFFNLRIFHFN